MKRLGAPFRLPATEAMLMIEPRPCCSMPGTKARIMRYIARTLRSTEKSKATSSQSSRVPWCTKPAPLKSTSTAPTACAVALMASASRTSSLRTSMPRASAASFSSRVSSMSVAITRAPSRANASAVARPMPWPAAVRKAVLPSSLDVMAGVFRVNERCVGRQGMALVDAQPAVGDGIELRDVFDPRGVRHRGAQRDVKLHQEVRADGQAEGVGHVRDLQPRRDAADARHVGLHDGAGALLH